MSNRVAILKKVSLAGLAEGWDDQCFVVVRPASYKQFKEYIAAKPEDMDEAQGIELITHMVSEQFVSGKIMVLNADNQPELGDATKEDIENLSVEMLNALFTGIMGVNYDPKATPMDLKPSNPSSTSGDSTAEPSSEETQPTSPAAS
jgi:hypothetical protein